MKLLPLACVFLLVFTVVAVVAPASGDQNPEAAAGMVSGAAVLALLFLAGVGLNALFAGYETGFIASNPIRIRYLAEKENNPAAQTLLRMQEHPDRMITVVLVGTNLAMVMGTMAISDLVRHPLLATLIATPVFLFFGEVLPKSMFRIHATRLALLLLPVIRAFDLVLAPLALPITWISRRFLRLVADEQRSIRRMMQSEEDVRVLVDESAVHGTIDTEEKEMIHSIMDLHSRLAREVMVPRIDIRALPRTATRQELADLFVESGYSRIPIYEENIDQIIGVASVFDVLTDRTPGDESIERFILPVLHVPDTIKLDDVLAVMRRERQRVAVVTDEYGGTDGLITLEDILEEIFGEIHDEHDKAERRIKKMGPNAWVIDARMPLEDAVAAMGLDIRDDEVETVAGWVMHRAGGIPRKGEVLDFGVCRVTILEGGPNYVSSVRLEVRGQEQKADEQAVQT